MAAITADNTATMLSKIIPIEGMIVDLPVAATTVIYKNSFVGFNAAGYLVSYVPWAQAATPTGTPFVGIALEHITSQTAAGDATCKVQLSGFFEYALTAGAQLDVGKPVFALDNATLTKLHVPAAVATGGGYELVGSIIGIPSAGNVLVDMGTPLSRSGYGGGQIVSIRRIDVANLVDDEVYLLHETQNHNGAYLKSVNGFITEAVVSTTASAVVTIAHTVGTDTSLGCTVTFVNAGPAADLVVGAGGVFTGVTAADVDNLVLIPADVGVVAKVTTVAAGGTITGAADLAATFVIR